MSFVPSCNVSIVPSIVLTAARSWASVGGYTPAHKTPPVDCSDQWDSFFESHCEATQAIETQEAWLTVAQEAIDPPLVFGPPVWVQPAPARVQDDRPVQSFLTRYRSHRAIRVGYAF